MLVDDARLFLAPPPLPHKADHWPELPEVVSVRGAAHPRYIAVCDNVIVSVPRRYREALVKHLRYTAATT